MKETYDLQPEELIRKVYLKQLAGEALNDTERAFLNIAFMSKPLRKLCEELKEIYESPSMMELLKVKPTSSRIEDIVNKILAEQRNRNQTLFIRKLFSYLFH